VRTEYCITWANVSAVLDGAELKGRVQVAEKCTSSQAVP
jgi:hypothetical protein